MCVNYHARAQWSNSGLQVEDLKAAITPSHQLARSACSQNGQILAVVHTSRASTMRVESRFWFVPSAQRWLREQAITHTHWTEPRAESRARR